MQKDASASVKLHLKNMTSIFRKIDGVEKVWLQVAVGSEDESADSYMRVQLQCASGLRKKFDLAFQEVTSMNAVYDKGVCAHHLCADPSVFLDCLKNFPPSLAEVSLVATADALTLKNDGAVEASVEAENDPGNSVTRVVRTEMRLLATDFYEYHLGVAPPPAAAATQSSALRRLETPPRLSIIASACEKEAERPMPLAAAPTHSLNLQQLRPA